MAAGLPLPNLLLPDAVGVTTAEAGTVAGTPPATSVEVAEALLMLVLGEFRAGVSDAPV
jgi:hypothetical protein